MAGAEAYFAFLQDDPKRGETAFVFRLTDPARIAEARAILADPGRRDRSVQGTIVGRPAPYNPDWSFHLDPATIRFFEMQIEVCDAAASYVEDHLDAVGGAFLPDGHWCPWTSRLDREITDIIDPQSGRPRLRPPPDRG